MGADFESLEACVGDKSDSAKAVADGKRQARQAQRQASALARLAELRSDLPRLTQDLEQGQCVSAFMEASAIMETLRELETQLAPVPTARLRELADGCRKIADTALLRVTRQGARLIHRAQRGKALHDVATPAECGCG